MLALDGTTPVADIVAHVDRLRTLPGSRDELVGLLREQSPLYAGRPASEVERLRGYLLASFEATGLPASATAYVLEELESGHNPYAVAAAAKAARGAHGLPERVVPFLLDAIDRIRQADDVVCFDSRAAPARGGSPTTALMELFRTLAWLGSRADAALPALRAMAVARPSVYSEAVLAEIEKAVAAVSSVALPAMHSCCAAPSAHIPSRPPTETDLGDVELQDQDGAIFPFGEFFRGRHSILTFFYTRCVNPDKCSLTITKLARLQQRIRTDGLHDRVNIAAITYDPAFDLPRRLRSYGAERNMSFDGRNRLLRTTGPFEPFLRCFDLGVGYGSTTVNRHRLDVAVLDDAGRRSVSFTRTQWQEDDVLAALKAEIAHR